MHGDMANDHNLDTLVWRRLRPYLDLANQSGLAERIGVPQQRISSYKHRKWQRPPLDVLDDLARAFGLTLAQILSDQALDETAPWKRRLYAAVAGLDEASAEALLMLLERMNPADAAPPARGRHGQKRSGAKPTR